MTANEYRFITEEQKQLIREMYNDTVFYNSLSSAWAESLIRNIAYGETIKYGSVDQKLLKQLRLEWIKHKRKKHLSK